MGGSERVAQVVTLSGSDVTLRKEFVEDEYTVPTISFVVDNESDEAKTIEITETVPEEYSVDAVGFHPEYGADHWTCYEDERAEFERDVPPKTTYETVYGVRIDDPSEAEAFMTEPRLVVDGESIGDVEAADHGGSETEVEKELLDGTETAPDDGTGNDDAATNGDAPAAGVHATNGAATTAVPGPETGSVIERLVEELRRNDVDADQKAVLREQLDIGVPSETKARIDQLGTRVETIAAYADALEEFLDEEGTAQEVISDFETQVEALREDVASIREQTTSNAGEIADVDEDLGSLESQVDDLEGTVSTVADRVDDVDDSLATTDSHLETVEADLRQAEDRIDANATDVDELDGDLTEVEGDITDVEGSLADVEENLTDVENDLASAEERVSETESHVATLDEAAAGLRTDLDDVEGDVDALETTAADTEADVEGLASDLEGLEAGLDEQQGDLAEVRDEVEDLADWRAQLGEMFE